MRTLSAPSLLAVTVTSLAVSLAGCAESLPPGTSLASGPPAAGPGEALVTFVRPVSSCDTGEYAVVVDDRGRFVGNVATGTRIAVSVMPGLRAFYAWSNVDVHVDREPAFNPVSALRVNVANGQEQYVALEVAAPCNTRSTFSMRLPLMMGMHPAPGQVGAGGDVDDMLASTKLVTVDQAAGQVALDAKPAHLRAHLAQGEAALRRGEDTGAQAAQYRTIQKEDSTD